MSGTDPDPRPRRRQRRVLRPATDGIPEDQRAPLDPAPDAEAEQDGGPDGATGSDRWWQEQRPPHWE